MVDDRGNAYVNTIGFDFPGGEFAPGLVVLVTPEGHACEVADDLAFPNGMVISPDGATLVVAESYANRLTADTHPAATAGSVTGACGRRRRATTPDGICMDAEGAVWYADVGNRHCVRVREGGEVLATVVIAAPSPARSAAAKTRACSSSARPGADPGLRNLPGGLAFPAPAPGAGRP